MRAIVVLLLLTVSFDFVYANDNINILEQRYSKEDFIRLENWHSLCSQVQVLNENDKIVLKSNGYQVKGDTLFLVELYSMAPGRFHPSSSFSFSINSDSILSIVSGEAHMEKIVEKTMSYEYKLITILKRREYELLEKWNAKIIDESDIDTPSAKFFVTMIYRSDKGTYCYEWSFYRSLLQRKVMKDYLLDLKEKGKDYYDPDFNYWMRDDF